MNIKLIVAHLAPDLDAVASVWLLKRFDEQHFGESSVDFVPAGERISRERLEELELEEKDVVHVDTGMGEFDHHTDALAGKRVCAASLVRDHVVSLHPEIEEDEALERMVEFVIEIDHFGEIFWPEPNADRYIFMLDEILHHLKSIGKQDEEVVEFALTALDSIYAAFKVRVAAEEEVGQGTKFETPWGEGLAIETSNDEVIKYGQKQGFVVVVRKDPEYGNIRIKAVPGKKIDLTKIYEKILRKDPEATWYFHPAKTMLLNGSRKKQNQVSSILTLEEVIGMFKGI